MGLWDWLLPDTSDTAGIHGRPQRTRAHPTSDARSRADKLAGVPFPTDVTCGTCGTGGNGRSCRCDPDLGRPRRWWE